ncbi:MAG TPA: MarR family transcriptional regulator [Saprospiraceae bacterium]|nr:MarR family transcriptional regulator [Saprospiraceae bacterium]
MKYKEAREQLIRTWGQLSSEWGINRTMGQIHALLMMSPDPLTADQIINELAISRGNVSMNLRSLVEWGLVQKVYVTGDRKEYFGAEKDVWKMALRIARERKQRELDPVIQSLQTMQNVETDGNDKREVEELNKMTAEMLDVAMQIDKVLDIGIRGGGQSLVRKLISVLR